MTKKTMNFQTETKQILNLMIHSLYSNQEIFLRELISNASDAIDKLKFEEISNPKINNCSELFIEICFDKEANTITIKDNGIGMTEEEVINNIGTIAKSGTKSFIEKLTGDQKKDANLIGQFGVGFYASFIVSNQVELITLKAGEQPDQAIKWESDGSGEFSIESIDKLDGQGTTIILHLKNECKEFAEDWRIRNIVNKYSDHINYPIKMWVEKTDPESQTDNPQNENIEDKDPSKDQPAEKKITVLETVNKASALWTRNKKDISKEEYQEFYRHISHDYKPALTWIHSKVEGNQEYTMLLYIPEKAPFDLFDQNRKYGIKLYIKKVFIMDEADKLMPLYLRFIKGIVDSADLPLNVSREILQSSKDVDSIRTGCTKKILTTLEDLANKQPEQYNSFWLEFGQVLKEGIIEDFSNKEKIAKLCRFSSTHNENSTQTVSLDDYISRMKPEQEQIFYIIAENYNIAKNSPHLEIFRKNDIEVLLLTDRIDDWVVSHLSEYDKKTLVSISKEGLDLSKLISEEKQSEEDKAAEQEKTKPLIEKIKKILGDKVKDVVITKRLVLAPACLLLEKNAMSMHMQKLLQQSGQNLPESKPTLEINPDHKIVKMIESETNTVRCEELSTVLYEQAMLSEGMKLEDPNGFINRINSLL